jgi:hypothetical protein
MRELRAQSGFAVYLAGKIAAVVLLHPVAMRAEFWDPDTIRELTPSTARAQVRGGAASRE